VAGCLSCLFARLALPHRVCEPGYQRIKDCSHCARASSSSSSGGSSRPPRLSREEKSDLRAKALSIFAHKAGISKKDLICKYYLEGKCTAIRDGRKECGKTHDSRPANTIYCFWGMKCNKSRCGYLHAELPKHRTLENSPSKTPALSRIPEEP